MTRYVIHNHLPAKRALDGHDSRDAELNYSMAMRGWDVPSQWQELRTLQGRERSEDQARRFEERRETTADLRRSI